MPILKCTCWTSRTTRLCRKGPYKIDLTVKFDPDILKVYFRPVFLTPRMTRAKDFTIMFRI